MAFDRRSLLLGGMVLLGSACARAQPGGSGAVTSNVDWATFKAAFLDPTGRVVDNGNGGVSHSEGQGYALMLAVRNGDRAAFDRMFDWTQAHLARPDVALYAWRYDPRETEPVADPNNATDGDIFIAWALAEAARLWRTPRYRERSDAIRAAIRSRLVVERHDRLLLLPGLDGFMNGEQVTLNPSYYVWSALDAFRALDGDAAWGRVIADGEALIGKARFGPLALPTDWIDVGEQDRVTPAAGRPARFGFDAVRVPLYAWAGGRVALLPPIIAWWQGYVAGGKAIPAWVDVQSGESAPYALSAGGMAIAARLLGMAPPTLLSDDYYAATLQLLAATPR